MPRNPKGSFHAPGIPQDWSVDGDPIVTEDGTHLLLNANFDNSPPFDGIIQWYIDTPDGQRLTASAAEDADDWSTVVDTGSILHAEGVYGLQGVVTTLTGETAGYMAPVLHTWPS